MSDISNYYKVLVIRSHSFTLKMTGRSKEPKIEPRNKPTHSWNLCYIQVGLASSVRRGKFFSRNAESIDYPYEKNT